ncbi:MAG: TlpA disulfide reductase family protein [Betaproteobacteria bacterium]|nr:TlpA disulfide reductase family protein [Betaproteobacteria bacterium]
MPDALHLGPLLIPADRLRILVALLFLVAGGEILARRVDRRIGPWAWNSAGLGLIAARIGYVSEHWAAYWPAPFSSLYVWQGGFDIRWGVAAGLLMTIFQFRSQPRVLRWLLLPIAVATSAWLAIGRLAAPPLTGIPLPNLSLPQIDGGVLALPQLRGKPTVLNLWATWCPPCRREMPMLAATAQRDHDVQFVFADQEESRMAVAHYLSRLPVKPRTVLLDHNGQLADTLHAVGYPTTFFFNRAGRLVASHTGEISQAALDDRLSQLVPSPSR